jgi:hypothetical protein
MNQQEKILHVSSLSPSNWEESIKLIKSYCQDEDLDVVENAIASFDEFIDVDSYNFLFEKLSDTNFNLARRYIWLSLRNYTSLKIEEFAQKEIYREEKKANILQYISQHTRYFHRELAVKNLLYLLWEFPDKRVNVFAVDSLYWHNGIDLYDEWKKLTDYGHFYIEKVAAKALKELDCIKSSGLSLFTQEKSAIPVSVRSLKDMLNYALSHSEENNILVSARISLSPDFQILIPSIKYENPRSFTESYDVVISRIKSAQSITFDYVYELEQSLLSSQILISDAGVVKRIKSV